jgi:hypothetical protein
MGAQLGSPYDQRARWWHSESDGSGARWRRQCIAVDTIGVDVDGWVRDGSGQCEQNSLSMTLEMSVEVRGRRGLELV